jgi:hypothetical protein
VASEWDNVLSSKTIDLAEKMGFEEAIRGATPVIRDLI